VLLPLPLPPVYQQKDTVYSFAVYDNNRILAFSKYNFNFDFYQADFASELPSSPTKSDIFYDFLIRNDTDLNKPFSVRSDLVKYFNPITPDIQKYHDTYGYCPALNYMQSVNPTGVVSNDVIFEQQFQLIEYSDNSVRRLQDYIYYDEQITHFFTKYNFDFDSYKKDWNVFSIKKLPVFTDFVLRTQYLNHTIIGAYGYGKPLDNFIKYFIQYPGLQEYLLRYSVTSIYSRVSNSYPNIDWNQYKALNSDLLYPTVPELQEHYIEYGQFEQRVITFIPTANSMISNKTRSIVSVMTEDVGSASGFLYSGSSFNTINGTSHVYLVTCYHLISGSQNINSINATVNYFDSTQNKQVTNQLAFRIIGYDIYTDVLVALYDPTLDYNIQFNSDLNVNNIPVIDIDGMVNPLKNDSVYTIGNIGTLATNVVIEGKLMDNKYRGDYNTTFVLGMPDSYLINFNVESGISGSPIFQENNDNCIGMIVGTVGEKSQYALALSGYYLSAVAFNAVARWYTFGPLYALSNINTLNFFIKDAFPKKWLGVKCKYYNETAKSMHPAFNNFNLNSGLIVSDFIIGFDKTMKKFITNSLDLDKYNILPLNTPLLNTKMYQRFIINNRVPIVIESILVFENVESDFDNFTFGLKDNQEGLSIITYDLSQIESQRNDSKYTNGVKRLFPSLKITYHYYNGNTWVKDTETVGGNTPDWYSEYTADNGQILNQHNFEFPLNLISYSNPYISCFGNICSNNINTNGIPCAGTPCKQRKQCDECNCYLYTSAWRVIGGWNGNEDKRYEPYCTKHAERIVNYDKSYWRKENVSVYY
jgi:hypothetical protein